MQTIIFDLDGTLSLLEHRRHLVEGPDKNWGAFFEACDKDLPNVPVVQILKSLEPNYRIEIWSGRSDTVMQKTVKWLEDLLIQPATLLMRLEGDFTPDVELKKQWLDALTQQERDNILCVFDDRQSVVDMWRAEGLTCVQVAPGDF